MRIEISGIYQGEIEDVGINCKYQRESAVNKEEEEKIGINYK